MAAGKTREWVLALTLMGTTASFAQMPGGMALPPRMPGMMGNQSNFAPPPRPMPRDGLPQNFAQFQPGPRPFAPPPPMRPQDQQACCPPQNRPPRDGQRPPPPEGAQGNARIVPFNHPLIELSPELQRDAACPVHIQIAEADRGRHVMPQPVRPPQTVQPPQTPQTAQVPDPTRSNDHSNHRHGNNGLGNGTDPQPPGNPPVNDGAGTSPGNPGNRGHGHQDDAD